ncbi:hypothetical protein RRF57_012836 [Xylaria bambusicola]|uniref:Uncharacterized protein n=1 Tax=Xylaria bambusicola TaxID=326684 RepID=A0AAN7V4M2_9PEZI
MCKGATEALERSQQVSYKDVQATEGRIESDQTSQVLWSTRRSQPFCRKGYQVEKKKGNMFVKPSEPYPDSPEQKTSLSLESLFMLQATLGDLAQIG